MERRERIKALDQRLSDKRDRCVLENRDPSKDEMRIASKILEEIKALEGEKMDKKLANKMVQKYVDLIERGE